MTTAPQKISESEVTITVPLCPPSVNAYVRHTRRGGHYITEEASAYKWAVWRCAVGTPKLVSAEYCVEATIYLGKGQKGDVDNFGKVLLDSLVYAKVIHSDAAITDLILRKRRDRDNPRTEIRVKALRNA